MRPRTVLRIARWEVSKGAGKLDRRTAAVAVGGLLLVVALVPAVAGQGIAVDSGIYRIGVSGDHPLHGPAAADSTFAVRDPRSGVVDDGTLTPEEGYDIYVDGRRLYLARRGGTPTDKSQAALAALRTAVEDYNDRVMREEPNQSAAYPVFPVTLQYAERERVREVIAPRAGDGGGGGAGPGGGDGATGDGGDGGATPATGDGGGRFGAPAFGGDILGTGTSSGAPSDLAPPFPFQSLLLAFVFVLPLNFVIQAYGSTILSERLNRRGELLLVAPVEPREIIAGKTLPYLVASLAITAVIALVVGGGPLSVLAVAPLALLFLGATFVGAMFARSFKELTFVTVTISVFLTSYAFVPAIFTDVGSVALISPLTLVVRDLSGATVTPANAVFATLPATLTALVLFVLGGGVYREEDMFTQRPVHLKALDALASRIVRARSLVLVTALLVPFVFVAELLAVALLFLLVDRTGGLALPLLLALVALIEELAKSLPVYAGFLHARYPRTWRGALVAGGFSGLGFFLAEKLTLVVQLVGLPELAAGRAAFQTPVGGGPLVAVGLLLAPLALHVVTACVSALGASRDRDWYAIGLSAAIVLHVVYNLAVVTALGGIGP